MKAKTNNAFNLISVFISLFQIRPSFPAKCVMCR